MLGLARRAHACFEELKEQAADLDPYELTDARLVIRPQMEHTAHDRIQSGLSSGKVSFWGYEGSILDTDTLLREEDMAALHKEQKRRSSNGWISIFLVYLDINSFPEWFVISCKNKSTAGLSL